MTTTPAGASNALAPSPTSHLPPTTDNTPKEPVDQDDQQDSRPLTSRDLKQEAGEEDDDHHHQEEQNANLNAGAEMESADVENAKSQT